MESSIRFAIIKEDGHGSWSPCTTYDITDPMPFNADVEQLNYITKYIELLDTVFLVLKKKPLSISESNPPMSRTCADFE